MILATDSPEADASGYEPIWLGTRQVGFVTSGGFGHCVETSLAMGYVDSAIEMAETDLVVTILGERRHCRILAEPPFDPAGSRMRS